MLRHLLLTITICLWSNGVIAQTHFKAAFWNVENLFDTTDDALIQDEDFTPTGKYLWTEDRLEEKLQNLSRVIQDINQNNDLAILGLAEIENKAILNRLNEDYIHAGMNIIHKESPDERGIDCALLYNPEILELRDVHFLPIFLAGDEKTRDIVEAEFTLKQSPSEHTLYVYVNHWPSRWGGQEKTEPLRKTAARTLRTRIDQILTKDANADILIMGDFNDYPDNSSLFNVLRAHAPGPQTFPGDLINTTWALNEDPQAGTCKYRGDWTVLDQLIISTGMQDKRHFEWDFDTTRPFMPDYLIEQNSKYAGWPFRTYRYGNYQAGFSDHLPIMCNILFSQK